MLENFPSISFNSRFKTRDGSRKKNSPFEKSNFTFKKMENRREASKTVERKGKEKNLTLKKLNFWNIVSTFHRFIVLPIFPPPLPSPLLPLSLPMIDRRGRVYGPRIIEHNRETRSYAPKFVSTRYSRRGPSNTSGNTGGLSS